MTIGRWTLTSPPRLGKFDVEEFFDFFGEEFVFRSLIRVRVELLELSGGGFGAGVVIFLEVVCFPARAGEGVTRRAKLADRRRVFP